MADDPGIYAQRLSNGRLLAEVARSLALNLRPGLGVSLVNESSTVTVGQWQPQRVSNEYMERRLPPLPAWLAEVIAGFGVLQYSRFPQSIHGAFPRFSRLFCTLMYFPSFVLLLLLDSFSQIMPTGGRPGPSPLDNFFYWNR